jgi:hypothetical protein
MMETESDQSETEGGIHVSNREEGQSRDRGELYTELIWEICLG